MLGSNILHFSNFLNQKLTCVKLFKDINQTSILFFLAPTIRTSFFFGGGGVKGLIFKQKTSFASRIFVVQKILYFLQNSYFGR